MDITDPTGRGWRTMAGILAVSLAFGACSHVSQSDLDGRLQELRSDLEGQMEEGDQAVRSDLGSRISDLEGRMDGLESELEGLADELNTTVERLESAIRFNAPVHFAFDTAELDMEGERALDRFAGVVQEYYPDALITVEGFTDPVGTEEYNMQLGMRRAQAVKTYLTESAGIPESQLRAVSYGEQSNRLVNPEEHGPGESGMANRRAVLVIEHPAVGSGMGSMSETMQ